MFRLGRITPAYWSCRLLLPTAQRTADAVGKASGFAHAEIFDRRFAGDCAQDLESFVALTKADELMVVCGIHDHAARVKSYKIVSEILYFQSIGLLRRVERPVQACQRILSGNRSPLRARTATVRCILA
jgi:hypothetical protein